MEQCPGISTVEDMVLIILRTQTRLKVGGQASDENCESLMTRRHRRQDIRMFRLDRVIVHLDIEESVR